MFQYLERIIDYLSNKLKTNLWLRRQDNDGGLFVA